MTLFQIEGAALEFLTRRGGDRIRVVRRVYRAHSKLGLRLLAKQITKRNQGKVKVEDLYRIGRIKEYDKHLWGRKPKTAKRQTCTGIRGVIDFDTSGSGFRRGKEGGKQNIGIRQAYQSL